MTIEDIIEQRGISEILHFTTNWGITGILGTGVVKSRKRLPEEEYLEYIYMYNCESRNRDITWHDYVNLSLTTVNRKLFGISAGNWHAKMDGWWCILSFSPETLTHDGVIFTTTNNIYTGVKRDKGSGGLEKLFSPITIQWRNNIVRRTPNTPTNQPTCPQAEVLYPQELSIQYLQCIYVKADDHASAIESQFDLFNISEYECLVEPGRF